MFRKIHFSCITNFWKQKQIDFGEYNVVIPQLVNKMKTVPVHIPKPDYYKTGTPPNGPSVPEIKNNEQIKKMRASCKLASLILNETGTFLQVDKTTDEIDNFVHELILKHNAYPSPLNYKRFPKSVCTSVNNVACHGIPDNRRLQNGDIINIDITVYYDGYHGDCSRTFPIGRVDNKGLELISVTELCLNEAINLCMPGVKFSRIGNFIEERAQSLGYNVVPSLAGHGIGEYFHGPPDIYHCRNTYPGVMEAGMTFTIEPALTQGSEEIVVLEDGWTAVTEDNARSAQCEHTVLITDDGVEILTS